MLSPFPPSFRDPAFPLPATAHSNPRSLDDRPPPWRGAEGVPAVYFTLGTVFNLESGDLFERVLAGLRELPIEVVATVGTQIEPAELGPLRRQRPASSSTSLSPPSCRAAAQSSRTAARARSSARWRTACRRCVLPMGADQPLNAARCEELGVAGGARRAHEPRRSRCAEAVTAVLSDPAYRSAAERIRDEIAALPGPEHAVTLLERLGAERRPAHGVNRTS